MLRREEIYTHLVVKMTRKRKRQHLALSLYIFPAHDTMQDTLNDFSAFQTKVNVFWGLFLKKFKISVS